MSVYRTVSFWFCLVMAWINLVLMFIARAVHSKELFGLALCTALVCCAGAAAHHFGARYAKRR